MIIIILGICCGVFVGYLSSGTAGVTDRITIVVIRVSFGIALSELAGLAGLWLGAGGIGPTVS